MPLHKQVHSMLPCPHSKHCVYGHYPHNMQHCISALLAPLMKEVAHVHIAGIDVVTLAVLVTLQRPQHHTIVIICKGEAHTMQHTLLDTLYCTYTHRCWQSGSSACCRHWLLQKWTYPHHHRGTVEDTPTTQPQESAIGTSSSIPHTRL